MRMQKDSIEGIRLRRGKQPPKRGGSWLISPGREKREKERVKKKPLLMEKVAGALLAPKEGLDRKNGRYGGEAARGLLLRARKENGTRNF